MSLADASSTDYTLLLRTRALPGKKKKGRKKKQQAKSCLIIRKESTKYQLKILVLIRLNRKKKQAFDGLKN